MTGDKTSGGFGPACSIIPGGKSPYWQSRWEAMRNMKWESLSRRIRSDFQHADAAMYGSLVQAFDIVVTKQPIDLCCGGGGNWGHEWNCDRLRVPFVPLRSTVMDVQDRSGAVGPAAALVDDLIERGLVSEDQVSAPPPSHDDPDVKRLLDYYGISGEPSPYALVDPWRTRTTDDYSLLKYILDAPNPFSEEEKNIPVMFGSGAEEHIEYVSGTDFSGMMFGQGDNPSYSSNPIRAARAMQAVADLLAAIKNTGLW